MSNANLTFRVVFSGLAALTIAAVNREAHTVGAVTIVRDVTEERQLQEQRTRFIANASHELRTPMTSIKSYLWMAISGQATTTHGLACTA